MKTLAEIQQILAQNKALLQEKYHVTDLGIFGSYARGNQDEKSDVDILIDYTKAPSLLQLIELEEYLSDQIGKKVEVVTRNGLKERIRARVLAEVLYI